MAGIDNIRSGHSLTNTSRSSVKSEQTKTESPESQSGSSVKDAVSISDQGKAIGQMSSQLAATPAFDNSKVQAIKEAIANGSYVVDAEKLADNMIRFENELGDVS
ncbi:flagellar biosynthesis anti-sigma factor FlgM [Vibrio sp. RC27]